MARWTDVDAVVVIVVGAQIGVFEDFWDQDVLLAQEDKTRLAETYRSQVHNFALNRLSDHVENAAISWIGCGAQNTCGEALWLGVADGPSAAQR